MTKTFQYSQESLALVQKTLNNFKNQGAAKDYEIRIDDLTVVHRTDNLQKFNFYKESLNEYSTVVVVFLFKGKSRKYDKYVLERKGKVSPDPNTTTEDYINGEIKKALDLRRQEIDFSRLKEQNRQLKKRGKRLNKKLQDLEKGNKNALKELIQLAAVHFGSAKVEEIPKAINGIPTADLMRMMNAYRKEWGDELFARTLGISIAIGKSPELMPIIEEIINKNIKENEDKTS